MITTHLSSLWYVLEETYRKKHVYVVARLVGSRGRVEYKLNERTERKARYFDATIAARHAAEMNAAKAQGGAA